MEAKITLNLNDSFTSTGLKFWKHPYQMNNYKTGNPNTIITTHISPESSCNLHCEYCSVKKRVPNRIELPVIKDYVEKLITRGLKAVIITGGGEPTFYPHFNEMVDWLKNEKRLSLGLITNGTNSFSVEDWDAFSWVRVSINFFPGWYNKIELPLYKIDESKTITGMSYIDGDKKLESHIENLKYLMRTLGAVYVRILPNCLLSTEDLEKEHERINEIFEECNLNKFGFFHQYKNHSPLETGVCHQSYFRPYLSEVGGGTVYPCDSVVLNDQNRFFHDKYKLCDAKDILEFLDRKIKPNFMPYNDCDGCVFHNNIQMLDDWVKDKINRQEEVRNMEFIHEDFV